MKSTSNSTKKQELALLRKLYIIFEKSLIKVDDALYEISERNAFCIIDNSSVLFFEQLRGSLSECLDNLAAEMSRKRKNGNYTIISKDEMSFLKINIIKAEINASRILESINKILA